MRHIRVEVEGGGEGRRGTERYKKAELNCQLLEREMCRDEDDDEIINSLATTYIERESVLKPTPESGLRQTQEWSYSEFIYH